MGGAPTSSGDTSRDCPLWTFLGLKSLFKSNFVEGGWKWLHQEL